MSYIQTMDDTDEMLEIASIDANRYMRHIRDLEKKTKALSAEIEVAQNVLVKKVKQSTATQQAVEKQYEQIVEKQKLCYGMALEKVKVSEQMFDLVKAAIKRIQREISKLKEELRTPTQKVQQPQQRQNGVTKRKQKHQAKIRQRLAAMGQQYQTWSELKPNREYCYCNGPSYGEMVECMNLLCQKEWFHRRCINERAFPRSLPEQLPETWMCDLCKDVKDAVDKRRVYFQDDEK